MEGNEKNENTTPFDNFDWDKELETIIAHSEGANTSPNLDTETGYLKVTGISSVSIGDQEIIIIDVEESPQAEETQLEQEPKEINMPIRGSYTPKRRQRVIYKGNRSNHHYIYIGEKWRHAKVRKRTATVEQIPRVGDRREINGSLCIYESDGLWHPLLNQIPSKAKRHHWLFYSCVFCLLAELFLVFYRIKKGTFLRRVR